MPPQKLLDPWRSFFDEIDRALNQGVVLHFLVDLPERSYDLPRETRARKMCLLFARLSTVKQIEAARELCDRFGRKVATGAEAREIMKIGVWYDSAEETLQNVGMPPNREGIKKGFTVFETDGKKRVDQTTGDSHPFPKAAAAAKA